MTHPRTSILDELQFTPAPLSFSDLPAELDRGLAFPNMLGGRALRVGSPWFLRNVGPQQIGKNWSDFCGGLRRANAPIFCRTADLDDVPAASIPVRFSKRPVGTPLIPLEVKTADAFELDCWSETAGRWTWPSEVGEHARMRSLVAATRVAAGGATPVGISLPAAASQTDLRACLDANVDFLTLVDNAPEAREAHTLLVRGLVTARDLFAKSGREHLPVLVVTNLLNPGEASKLLALGASAVSIDNLIMDLPWQAAPSSHVAGGLLSGIGSAPPSASAVDKLDQLFNELNADLFRCMRTVNANDLAAFNADLVRGTTQRASELAKVSQLSDDS